MDETDRAIVNRLQTGFPVCDRPFAPVAAELGIDEQELIGRLQIMLDEGTLSRFGPMYHAERMGGALTLCAMKVPPRQFSRVAEQVNRFEQVAHNYQRDHEWNMWFVLATENADDVPATIRAIESTTGLPVYDLPKLDEFYVGLHLAV